MKLLRCLIPVVALVCGIAAFDHADEQAPAKDGTKEFECRFTTGPISIDGKDDDLAWKTAQVIDHFYLPWLQEEARAAKTATRARLLWDREYLYFFAELEDHDLFADITEHDGKTWFNDVFELFFKPAGDKPGYYEFHVSAAGTVMDIFLPKRGEGKFEDLINDGEFHIESQVVRRGTLNQREDKDEAWSVEGRIPWKDFLRTGGRPDVDERWLFALCRYDYSVDAEKPELSTCAPLGSLKHADFHHHEDYATLHFVGPQAAGSPAESSALARLQAAMPQVESHVAGSPDPPLPFRSERVLPELKLSWPIFAISEPGSQRLLFIDQNKSYGPAHLCRTTDDPSSGEFETLLEFPDGGIAYSIAFHPDYEQNGYIYVGWNGAVDGQDKQSFITRYTIDRSSPYTLDPDSALNIIHWPSNGHNGAAVAFGLDGFLYVTSGDGTSDSDTNLTGQGMDHLLAKVLRIDVDHPDEDRAYSVPKDNPFVGVEGVRPETWAYGMRNPWRITVDPKTGNVWVGNNGQDLWEQAYLIQRGGNYGWSVYEGSHVFYANRELGPTPHIKPTLEHPHSESRSLTGGVVYYGDKHPELRGAYIYGDYSTGKIWGAKVDAGKVTWHRELADTTLQISAFAIDSDGELLIVDHRGEEEGGLYTLVSNENDGRSEAFPRTLAASGLFESGKGHHVADGLIPYSVNAPLWSDGAYKERYLYLPPDDATIDMRKTRGWDFPDNTVLVKSFGLPATKNNPQTQRWIETRFLTKQNGEWVGYSYAWNDEQTEAALVDAKGMDRTFYIPEGNKMRPQPWHFPSRTECMVCHSRAANFVLGLSTLQMNKQHDYGDTEANQLEVLEWLGVLRMNWDADARAELREDLKAAGKNAKEINEELQRIADTKGQRTAPVSSLLFEPASGYERLADPYDEGADLTKRARSYLHANCAQCHVEAGGGNAQIQLEFNTSLEKMNLLDVMPLHHKFDIDDARLVAPGAADRSVLLHRMAIRGRGQMPQLATSQVDEAAVAMLRKWIESLKSKPQEDN